MVMKNTLRIYQNGKVLVAGKLLAAAALLFMLSNSHITMPRVASSVNSLKRSLEPISDDFPAMTALLIYDGSSEDKDLRKIHKAFRRASGDNDYEDYVGFVSVDFSELDSSEKSELKSVAGLFRGEFSDPVIILLYNDRKVGKLTGERLESRRRVSDFVDSHFANDISKIKRTQESKIKKVVVRDNRPSAYVGFGFGSPFHYYSYPNGWYGRRYGRGYGYPGWYHW